MRLEKKSTLSFASALIPLGIYLITMMLLDFLPFGNRSMIISDAAGQYIDFAAYWKTVLTGQNDLFYTFTKTLGGDGLNLAAYYLLSPFNLVFLFSNTENLPLLYTVVMLLKVSACGLAFFWACGSVLGFKPSGLLFSTSYALMAYNVVYVWNIMWLDGVIVLPLMVLGLYRLLQRKAPWLYIFSLMYALAVNFYIGYMLCIAAVLLGIAILFLQSGTRKEKGAAALRFGAASVIAGFGSAVIWLPAFLALAGERGQTNAFQFTLERSFGLTGFFAKFLCGATSPQDVMGGLPNIFCGTVILLLAGVFFLSRRISLKEKLTAGCILSLLFLSFYFILPNTVWHGFSATNSFNYRYSFLFSFVLIVLAQYGFSKEGCPSKKAILPAAAIVLMLLLVGLLHRPGFVRLIPAFIGLMVLCAGTACLLSRQKAGSAAAAVLCIIGIAELGFNCYACWDSISDDSWMLNRAEYQAYVDSAQEAVDAVKAQDDGFYRMEKTFRRTQNDASLLGYNGLSHFSSTEQVFVKTFMRKMGFPTYYDFWAAYTGGSTAEVDSLLGVKYLLTKEDLANTKGYPLLMTVGDISVYQNPHALPLAILSSNQISAVSLREENPTALHNAIWQGLTGRDERILEETGYTLSLENMVTAENPDGSITYSKADPGKDACLCYEIPVSQEKPLYFYFSAPDVQEAQLFVNGENRGTYFDSGYWSMDCAGTFAPGETVRISFETAQESVTLLQPCFFYEDPATLADLSRQILSQALQLTQHSSSRFSGSFTADTDQTLLFSIPFSEGWQLQLDGQPVSCQKVLDTFLAVPVSAGEHTFRLQYVPRGLYAGCGLSALAVCMAGIWYCMRKKHAEK